jgi:rubrerythrin
MEKEHIVVLRQIQKKGIKSFDIPEVENLHISDYIVERPPSEMMSYQDILITAMKKEEAAYKLYTDLAGKQSETGEKNLFLKLASEEAKHKLTFEKLYDDEVLKQY